MPNCSARGYADGAKEHGEESSHEADGSDTRQACIEDRGARLNLSGRSAGVMKRSWRRLTKMMRQALSLVLQRGPAGNERCVEKMHQANKQCRPKPTRASKCKERTRQKKDLRCS